MEFKRTAEGRVFFSGASGDASNDEMYKSTAPLTEHEIDTAQISSAARDMLSRDKGATSSGMQLKVLTLLQSLNERLKLNQVERNTMRRELDAYKKKIADLEAKSDQTKMTTQTLKLELDAQKNAHAKEEKDEALLQNATQQFEEARRLLLKFEDRAESLDRNVSSLIEQSEIQKRTSIAVSKKQADSERQAREEAKALRQKIEAQQVQQDTVLKKIDGLDSATFLSKYETLEHNVQSALSRQERLFSKIDKELEDRARFMRKIDHIEQSITALRDAVEGSSQPLLTQGSGDYIPEDVYKEQINTLEELTAAKAGEPLETAQESAFLTATSPSAVKLAERLVNTPPASLHIDEHVIRTAEPAEKKKLTIQMPNLADFAVAKASREIKITWPAITIPAVDAKKFGAFAIIAAVFGFSVWASMTLWEVPQTPDQAVPAEARVAVQVPAALEATTPAPTSEDVAATRKASARCASA